MGRIAFPGFSLAVALTASICCASTQALAQPSAETTKSDDIYLIGGTVISMVPGQRPMQATILVRDGRIAAVGAEIAAPPRARVLDIAGRYILPGFVDMHAHVTFLRDGGKNAAPDYDRRTSEQILRQLLAYGITSVRNPAAPPAEGVRLRDDIERGVIVGPRIFTAGWPLNGRPSTPPAIRAEVERQCALKVDYIKVYANSTPEQTAAAIDAAHRCGLKVIGHLQATDWPTAARLGIDFLTHGTSWSASALPPGKRAEYAARSKSSGSIRARIFWLESVDVDGPEMDAVIAALKQHHISVDPTLVAYETKFAPMEKYRGAANIDLAPPAMRASWKSDDLTGDWTSEDYARMARVWPKMLAIVGRYYRSGVLLTVGTDLPNRFVVPGVSFDQELDLLHRAGAPNEAVLAMATRNAARALGHLDDSGTIEVGKRADLVVLEKNPLVDIHNVADVDLVIARGKVFRPGQLLESAGR